MSYALFFCFFSIKGYDAKKIAKTAFEILSETCKEWHGNFPSLFKNKNSYVISIDAIKNKRRKMEDKHVVLPEFNVLHGFDQVGFSYTM